MFLETGQTQTTATCFALVQTIAGFFGVLLIWVLQAVPYPEVNTRIPTIKPRRWFLYVSPIDSVRVGSQPSMTGVGMPIALWMPSDFLSAPFRPQESLGLHRFEHAFRTSIGYPFEIDLGSSPVSSLFTKLAPISSSLVLKARLVLG